MTQAVRPELLVARLSSDNEVWRVDAEARLIALGAEAVPLLLGAMQHANPAVRMHAAHALARIRDARGLPALVQALGDRENNDACAIAAERALVEWGEPAKGSLLESSRAGVDERVRARAIRALGKIGGEGLDPALRGLLGDPAAGVRAQAAVALTRVLGPASADAVAPLLEDPDEGVRFEVAEALVNVGSPRGEGVLRAARDDPEAEMYTQRWAEELLDQIDELRRTGRA